MAPHYFFDLHASRRSVFDQEGRECENMSVAREHAIKSARSIVAEDALLGFVDLTPRIEVRSTTDEHILTVHFAEAVLRVVES